MATKSILSLVAWAGLASIPNLARAEHANLQQAAVAVADRFIADNPAPKRTYMADLTLEALIELDSAHEQKGYKAYVLKSLADRGWTASTEIPWKSQPFSCLTFALYRSTQDKGWLPVFIEQSAKEKQEVQRSPEGAILHPRGEKRGGGQAWLIDALQEYASRMAKTGSVTGDVSYYQECAAQWRLYHKHVRDPKTGLWTQGIGWLKEQPTQRSPGAWSRGHGWVIRGMEESLRYLPRDSAEYKEVQGYFVELLDLLLPLQSGEGLWHCLLNRPASDSPLETSGSALIAAHIVRAIHHGNLEGDKYLVSASKVFAALPRYVDPEGIVLSTSPGPGPLESEEPWLKPEYPPGDPHGIFAVLHAAAAERLLDKK